MSHRSARVSVLMLTYNHERYLADAIESVMAQTADFAVELLIGDDCSTDGTVAIARKYQAQFSNISIFPALKNRGMYQNLARIFYRAKGDYIAFLEGDDYWLAPDKLQKQVNYLDRNRSVTLCFHPVRLIEDGKFNGNVFPALSKSKLTTEDILDENWVPTCSAVFRRAALPRIPFWCSDLMLLDWPLFLSLAEKGEVAFIPEELAAYRLHASGAWSQLAPQRKSERMIQVLRAVKRHFPARYHAQVDRRISELYQHIAWCCEDRKALNEALEASWKAASATSLPRFHPATDCVRLAIKSGIANHWHRPAR